MSIEAFVVALALGAALLAIWAVVRFPRLGPETLGGAMVQVAAFRPANCALNGLIAIPRAFRS